jgi:ABC-type nitrate/sulfonate/bicarbonate transport system substrate-binding protein
MAHDRLIDFRRQNQEKGNIEMRIVLVALLGFCAVHAAAAETVKLRYGQAYSSAHSIFSLPISVAQREGLFARQGLDVEVLVPIPGGSDKMIAALHDDFVDLTHVATPFLIRAAMAGSDAVAIAAEFDNPIYSLIAKPEIKTIADLKGRLVGLADEAGTIAISMRKLLALHGLGHGDFGVKVIEGTPTRWACLHRGECDAVVLGQPQDLLAMHEGFRLLGISNDAVPELLYTVTAVRRSWADAHKDAVTRYVRALAAAFQFIRDPAKRDRVIRTIVETTGSSDLIAGQTLDLYFQPERGVIPRHAEIKLKGLEQVIALMSEAGNLKSPLPSADRFVDTQYLQAAGAQ